MAKKFTDQEQAVLQRIRWCKEWLQDTEDTLYRYDTSGVDLQKVTLALIEARKACNLACDRLDEIVEDYDLHFRKF